MMSALAEFSEALQPNINAQTGDGTASWLLCRSGARHFALSVAHVVETMRALPVERLAGAPAIVCGLAVIRGEPTPVVDPAVLFDDKPARCERFVTVRTGSRTIAFAVEAVVGLREIAADDLEKLPPLLNDVQSIAAIKRLDDALVFFLQAARVVPDDILDACERAVP
jgi:chemotaxis signal transduction protein